MSKTEHSADMIQVSVNGTFKTEHIFGSSLEVLGKLTLNASKSEGLLETADGSLFRLKKISFWKSAYELQSGGEVIASAAPQGVLKRSFDLEYEGESYTLVPKGSKMRSWSIRDGQERTITEFLPRKGLKRGALIRIGAEIPLTLLVFAYLLVIRRWQEESSAG